jgi:DNA-binding XRE family transcriptional regulator
MALKAVPAVHRARPGIRVTGLGNDELSHLALCKELSEMPLMPESTEIGRVQRLFESGDTPEAVAVLTAFLRKNGLDFHRRRYSIDSERFAAHRSLSGLTQAQLASEIGLTSGQISHVQTGRSGVGILTMLLLVSVFGVPAPELMP